MSGNQLLVLTRYNHNFYPRSSLGWPQDLLMILHSLRFLRGSVIRSLVGVHYNRQMQEQRVAIPLGITLGFTQGLDRCTHAKRYLNWTTAKERTLSAQLVRSQVSVTVGQMTAKLCCCLWLPASCNYPYSWAASRNLRPERFS